MGFKMIMSVAPQKQIEIINQGMILKIYLIYKPLNHVLFLIARILGYNCMNLIALYYE